jgi:hypothetical protein
VPVTPLNSPRTVRNQAKTVRPDPVRHLDEHVREVEAQKEVDLARVGRGEDGFDGRAQVAIEDREASEEGLFPGGCGDAAGGDQRRAGVGGDEM